MQSSDPLSRTSELGSLRAHSNDESEFVGSSSGVFFVNTVRQAFAKSLGPLESAPALAFPAPEDTLVGSPNSVRADYDAGRDQNRPTIVVRTKWAYDPQIAQYLGEAPGLEDARQLMMMYFKIWHPLFPFLHGPSFLQTMEAFYSESGASGENAKAVSKHHRACWTAIFQCVFNISSILQPDLQLAQKSKVASAADAVQLANVLLNRHDILSLQAILAIQLYLVASMSLRNASLLGGTILRAVLHAGYHRCPYRYQQLSAHDRQLRKRIFWCFYAIDRYLSQALGLPLGIQDSDIDVCLPGAPESHVVGSPRPLLSMSSASAERASETAGDSNFQGSSTVHWSSETSSQEISPNREATLAGFVLYGRLTGRALELFHKSIHTREIRRSAVLYLVSDVHKWWNNLPSTLQQVAGQSSTDSTDDSSPEMGPLFSILYKHLILCINRPCLSLDPSSPDFCSGLQICIDAARSILSLLKTQLSKGHAFFWPSLLSAAYMAGLVITFACQLGQYSIFKGCQEISGCLDILQTMCRQWEIARHCHTALSILLLNIQRQSRDHESSSSKRLHQPNHEHSTQSKQRKKQKSTSTNHTEDHTTYQPYDKASYQVNSLPNSQNPSITAAQQTDILQPTESSSSSINNMFKTIHTTTSESTQIYHPPDENNLFPSEVSPTLSIPMISNEFMVDGLQWPDESSFLTTNFDLNMTDLFQNSMWDPVLFDAFNQG